MNLERARKAVELYESQKQADHKKAFINDSYIFPRKILSCNKNRNRATREKSNLEKRTIKSSTKSSRLETKGPSALSCIKACSIVLDPKEIIQCNQNENGVSKNYHVALIRILYLLVFSTQMMETSENVSVGTVSTY